MDKHENLMVVLSEECLESGLAISKMLRFGAGDRNPVTKIENVNALISELNDILGAAALLVDEGILPENWMSDKLIAAKKGKILGFLEYSRRRGRVTPDGLKPQASNFNGPFIIRLNERDELVQDAPIAVGQTVYCVHRGAEKWFERVVVAEIKNFGAILSDGKLLNSAMSFNIFDSERAAKRALETID